MRDEFTCENCGCDHTEENPVTYGPDPYRAEIAGDETPVYMCEECRFQSAQDI